MYKESIENCYSQHLYVLNQENLLNIQKLYSLEKKRLSPKNFKIFLSYLFNGGFSRILRRLRLKKLQSEEKKFILKKYDHFPNKKVVVYTCVWGKYDKLLEPFYYNPNVDYLIFTDQELPTDTVWKKIEFPPDVDLNKMNGIEVNRFCKMLPHKLFKNYDISVYIDGNIRIVTDIMPIIADFGENIIGIHDYQVDCIYDMKNAIIAGKRANKKDVNHQILKYKNEGFPKHFGAFECNVLVRAHNNEECIHIMESWWNEFNSTTSKRDQLSLPYVLWKNNKSKDFVFSLGHHVRENPRFYVVSKHNDFKGD